MYPNQQYPQGGGGRGAPYPQQQPHGIGQGFAGGQQPNMPGPYGGNQGGFGTGPGNQFGQAGFGAPGGNQHGQGGYGAPGGNQFGQGGFGAPGGNQHGQGGFGAPGGNQFGQGGFGAPGGNQFGQGGFGAPGGNQFGQGGFGSGGNPPRQGGDFAPNPGNFMPNDQRSQRLTQVIQQYEINQQFAARLNQLASCEIVVLCDDSGSMNTPIQGSNQTRWDELKSLVTIVVDIASVMDQNGVDVYFLNRDPLLNVTNAQNIRQAFNTPPQGLTPLVPALRRILAAKRNVSHDKKLLILVATDGAPTDQQGQLDIAALEGVLRQERTPQTYMTFLACTDDLQAVQYLSNWDKMMPNLDVMDDYRSERNEILRTRGGNFPFSFGDYIVKSLLGSMDNWFDSLDDRGY